MLYMVTFTINIPQMLAYIPYMDPMGNGDVPVRYLVGGLEHFYFSIIYGMSSFPLTFIFFKMVIAPPTSYVSLPEGTGVPLVNFANNLGAPLPSL